MWKPCPTCGQPSPDTYCPQHTHTRSHTERKRRQTAVENWKATQGNWCPGWNRPPHPTTDLTADHIQPRSIYGDTGPLRILCRQCNSTRGTATNTPTPHQHPTP